MSEPGSATATVPTKPFHDPGAPLPEMSRRERVGVIYERYADQVMFLVSLLFLLAFFFLFVPSQTSVSRADARTTLIITWAIFIVDYFIRVLLAPKPAHYMLRHPLVLVSLLFPPLRAFIALRAIVLLLTGTRGQRTVGAAWVAFWLVVIAILFGALAEVYFEAGAPNAEITTYGKALWWACVTVTTVGYGDYVPVTGDGKFVAVILMFVGVGLISTVSATIASGLISVTKRDHERRWARQAKRAAAIIGPDADSSDQPNSAQPSIDIEEETTTPVDSDDSPAAATLSILVDAIDRLQKEVAALRQEQAASVASGTNVTGVVTEKPDTAG